ncbi:HEAT repeat domain-containing protein [Bradyrhizobium sp. AZCC 1721]|uniref:HEAT repeat domain-containing protein n=1 Tax=Bradyrhizobium sp. AZCC 1721 TaxID=3117016 RepID=UPI002FF1A48E
MSSFDAKLPVNHEAIRALGSRNDAEALVTLAAVAAVDDQFLRRTAVEMIGRHPRGRELGAIILSALRDPSGYVVRTACDVVEAWSLKEAHALVLPLLANDSGATRRTALRALNSIWAETDFPSVFKIFKGDLEIEVRKEAAWVLRQQATSTNWRAFSRPFAPMNLPGIGSGRVNSPNASQVRNSYRSYPRFCPTSTATYEKRRHARHK